MSVLSFNELCKIVEQGVITDVEWDHINAASIDVVLGPEIYVERGHEGGRQVVDIAKREVFNGRKIDMSVHGHYDLRPGEFVLASTKNSFNLPMDICAEFKLKSSGARTGLENALATWCDQGWHGSVLTLELKNFLQWHDIRLTPGMRIGQMIFHRTEEVPVDRSYAARGRYNNDVSVQTVKE